MKISARNVLAGTVTKIVTGVVNSEVTLTLPGGQQLVAVVTKSSVEGLGIAEGKPVTAIIKSSNILLAVE